MVPLAAREARRLLTAAWPAPLAVGLAIGWAVAVQPLPAPVASPLAAPARPALLGAAVILAAALALAWIRGESAGQRSEVHPRDLRVRGAAAWQIAVLLVLAAAPLVAASALGGLVAGTAAAAAAAIAHAALGASAAQRVTFTQLLPRVLRIVVPCAAAPAILSAVAHGAAALSAPAHHRQSAGDRARWYAHVPADATLLALGWWLAHRVAAVTGGGNAARTAVFGALASQAGSRAPPAWLLPLGGALFLLGAALLAGRACHAASAILLRLRGARIAPVDLLAFRAAHRSRAPLRLALAPTLAVAALAYLAAGAGGIAATDGYLHRTAVGAPVAISETWTPPCVACLPSGALPDFSHAQSSLPGVAAMALEVAADTSLQTIGPSVALSVVGVDAQALGGVAVWPHPRQGARYLAELADAPAGAVISAALASATGLRPGDRLATHDVPNLHVISVAGAWPGVGTGDQPWAVVNWPVLRAALRRSNFYASGANSLSVNVLLRLAPGASVAALAPAIPPQAANVLAEMVLPAVSPALFEAASAGGHLADAVQRLSPSGQAAAVYNDILNGEPALGGPNTLVTAGGAGRLSWLLAPLGGLALLLLLAAIRGPDTGPASLPAGDALAALGAGVETRRARVRLAWGTHGAGAVVGLAAGTAAAALFFGPLSPYFQAWWLPLWLAAALAAVATVAALLAIRGATRAHVGDPVIVARVLQGLALSPPRQPERPALPRSPLAHALLGSPAVRAVRQARAVTGLAARRVWATRRRLPALAAGMLVAAALAATVPMFTTGALTRELRAGLPATSDLRPDGAVVVSLFPSAGQGVTTADLTRLGALAASAGGRVGIPATPPVALLSSGLLPISPPGGAGMGFVHLDALPDIAAHAHFQSGVPPAPVPEPDGTIDVAATAETMAGQFWGPFALGRAYALSLPGGGTLRVRITGVFSEARGPGGGTSTYWPYAYFQQDLFAAPGVLRSLALTQQVVTINEASWYTVLDLHRLSATTVRHALAALAGLQIASTDAAPGAGVSVSPYGLLDTFTSQARALAGLLRTAAIPVLALLLYFIALTAAATLASEAGEIAVHTGRGASTLQMAGLYLTQWVVLALPLIAVGPLVAAAFARAMGRASGFLRFTARAPLPILWQPRDFAYAAAAGALAVAAALLPVLAALARSIVETRAHAARPFRPPLWQRAGLDVWALAALAAAWLVLHPRADTTGAGSGASLLAGESALYLLPAAFLLVAGLLSVRALGWLLRTCDARLGDRLRVHTSLLVRRIGRLPAHFTPVVLLLCLATGLGTYSAAAAHTLAANLTAAARYRVGAQVRLVQASPCSGLQSPSPVCVRQGLTGPPPRPLPPFSAELSAPGVVGATQMLELPASVNAAGASTAATLVLVDPASYPRVAFWPAGLDPSPESTYMALLQSRPDAALLSPGLSGRVAGDRLHISVRGGDPAGALYEVGRIPRWPGADPTGPLIVAPLGAAQSLGVTCTRLANTICPGDRVVLMDLRPGSGLAAVNAALAGDGLDNTQTDVAATEVADAFGSPQWAAQNGMLDLGFLAAVLVAAVGYVLYAGLILRGQTGQLGLLRAIGVGRGTLVRGVALEQGALLAAGAIAGEVAGFVAAALFVPMYQPLFTGAGAPPFQAAGPGIAAPILTGVLVAMFAMVLGGMIWQLARQRIGETVKLEE